MSDEDRAAYLRDNAVAVVEDRDRKIERLRKIVRKQSDAIASLRAELRRRPIKAD